MTYQRKKTSFAISHGLILLVLTFLIALLICVPISGGARADDRNFGPQLVQTRMSPPELVTQTGHSMKVIAVALSPNNRVLASASADNTLRLWDMSSGNELRTLNGHTGWVKSVTFSPDGKLLASGSNDRAIRLWDVETGKELHLLAGHSAPVEALTFSADGHFLVSGSADNTAKVWDGYTGREVTTLRGHTDWVTGVTMSADGKWLATGSKDNTIRVWETATYREVRVLKGHTDRIKALTFSPDGQWLATGSFDHTVRLWKIPSGKEGKTLTGARSVIAIAFSAGGRQLLSAGDNKTIEIWDVGTGRRLGIVGDAANADFVESISFSTDRKLFVSSADKKIEIHDSQSGATVRTCDSRAAGFYALAFSANGRWLASGSKDRTVRLWDTSTGRELPALVGHTGYVTSISFSPDGGLLASASLDQTIRLWDTSTGLEIGKLTGHESTIDAIAFSPDSRWLASASFDRTVRLWNVAERRELRKLSGHLGEVTTVAFSSDGRWLASGSVDKTIRLWDTTTWNEQRLLDVGLRVNALSFSPDSKSLVAGADTTIKLFDVSSQKEVRVAKSESGEVRALAFSPDGRSLASAWSDEAIRLWDVADMSQPQLLLGHKGSVNATGFSGDGKWLASGSEDGTIILWDAKTGKKTATLMSFRDSNDWLVLTPDGLFDGSPASWNQILWRFSGNTFNFAPAEAFFNEFYYPGVLADMLSGKKPHAPQDISQKDRRQPQMNLKLATPSNESAVVTRTVDIKIELTEAKADPDHKTGSGVRDLRLFRNGSLVKVWHGDVALDDNGKAVLQTTISLMAGENNLTAYAFNRDNIKSSDVSLSVVGDEKLRRRGTAYILTIGVNQYANAEYNLRYAAPDAVDFGAELQRAQLGLGNFQDVEVIHMLDDAATKANIMLALRRLADSNEALPSTLPKVWEKLRAAQPEDAVVIYFAGHGTAPNDGRFYLIPHDLGYDGPRTEFSSESLRSILNHSISDRELEGLLERIDAGQFLLVIDACNSGQALEAEEKRRGPMNAKGLAQLAYEKGMHILTAAQSYQAALEKRTLTHGYLTYALVEEGLKTQAADTHPTDGQVTVQEWLDYAVGRVPQMQIGVAKDTQGRLLEHEADTKNKKERDVQRPRVFYRLGLETKPLIIVRPSSGN